MNIQLNEQQLCDILNALRQEAARLNATACMYRLDGETAAANDLLFEAARLLGLESDLRGKAVL